MVPDQRFYVRYRHSLHIVGHLPQAIRMVGPASSLSAWLTERVVGTATRSVRSHSQPLENCINRQRSREAGLRNEGRWLQPNDYAARRINGDRRWQVEMRGFIHTTNLSPHMARMFAEQGHYNIRNRPDFTCHIYTHTVLDSGAVIGSVTRHQRWSDPERRYIDYNVKDEDGRYIRIERFLCCTLGKYAECRRYIGIKRLGRAIVMTKGISQKTELVSIFALNRPIMILNLSQGSYIVEHIHSYDEGVRGKLVMVSNVPRLLHGY